MPGKLNLEISADASKAIAELQKTVAKLEETAQKARELGRAGKTTTESMQTGFAGVATSMLGMATGFLSIQGAIGLIRSLKEETQGLVTALELTVPPLRQLLQISGTSETQFRAARKLADQVVLNTTGFTEVKALEFVTKGGQTGATDEEILSFAENKRFLGEETVETFAAVRGLVNKLGGIFSQAEVLNLLGIAQGPSETGVAGISKLINKPLTSAEVIGGGLIDVAAAVGIGTVGSDSPEQTKTQLAALFRDLSRDDRFRENEPGIVNDLRLLKSLSIREREAVVRSDEGRFGASLVLERIDQIEQLQKDIRAGVDATGTPESFRNIQIDVAKRTPVLESDVQLISAQAQEGLARRFEAAEEQLTDAIIAKRRSILRPGANILQKLNEGLIDTLDDLFETAPRTLIRETAFVAGMTGRGNRELIEKDLLEQFGPTIRALEAAAKKMEQAADRAAGVDAADAAEVAEAPDVVLEE